MTDKELTEKLNLLQETLALQIDVTATMASQLANLEALLDAIMASQRKVLSKHGVSEKETDESQKSAHQAGVVVRTAELKALLARLKRIDPELGGLPGTRRN